MQKTSWICVTCTAQYPFPWCALNLFFTADLNYDCIITVTLFAGIFQVSMCGKWDEGVGAAGEDLTVDLVPVAFASLSLLEEGPYEGVNDVWLVLLQPVAGPRNNVETEMIPDVEATCLCHLLLQEGVPLTPQQQHRRPDKILAQGERAKGRTEERKKKSFFSPMRCI